ncbi:uncharacterized protein ACA1_371250 [Acanthamoeba castellanii str. Neff]|uniref:dUTP diphosphatase n=1 Tax=Acanthamoeba castellanii (strain ATCC 30010 / Neff) TaxID=1257118 RepID=L8GZ74_ACACF|nr:uncharacterized protein ACA1_371250 [Acanthamoeba castellanii str. Neff]ELR18300.1 hypothetical protein ACA1_371250 [Acanthamoeba castellanii str. Neff]
MQNQPLRIKLLVEGATAPRQVHSTNAGYNLFSAIDTVNGIDIGAGVVDAGDCGGVKALVFNHNNEDFVIACGHCIAQLILECIVTPEVEIVGDLDATNCGAN